MQHSNASNGRDSMIAHIDSLLDEIDNLKDTNADLLTALEYCARMLEMLCPDTAGTPAAVNAREVIAKAKEQPDAQPSVDRNR